MPSAPHFANSQGAGDAIAERAGTPVRRAFRPLMQFILLLAILWGLFDGIYASLPYIRPGAKIIYNAKARAMRHPEAGVRLFSTGASVRVLVMGNSKMLAGFNPAVFDQAAGQGVSSFNAGLPQDPRFLPDLEAILAREDRPTHVLLTMSWYDPAAQEDSLTGDGQVMEAIFPFHHLPRDLTLFALRARARGGLKAFYRQGPQSISDMLAARGYYFIEGQSHFADHRLPPDFRLDSDTPHVPYARVGDASKPEFQRLCTLLHEHHVPAIYVPLHSRVGEFAPATQNDAWARAVAGCAELSILGPDYWLFPNSDFADPVHLNPEGAADYSRRLAELVGPVLRGTKGAKG